MNRPLLDASPHDRPTRGSGRRRRTIECRAAATPVVLVAFPLVYGLIALHRGQDANWDLMNYHFFDPYWLLTDHLKDIMPAQEQTFFNPLLDIPFYYGVLHLSSRQLAFALAVVQGLSFPLLYSIARYVTPRRLVALAVAGLGMFAAGAFSEIGNVMGDTLTAPLFFGGVLAALRALGHDETRSVYRNPYALLVALSGGLAGIGSGLKLSALPLAAGLVLAFVAVSGTMRRRLVGVASAGVGVVVGVLVSYGAWGVELWTRYGDPLLPYFNGLFHSPWAPALANTDTRSLPHGVVDTLFYPIVLVFHPTRSGFVAFRELSVPIAEVLLIALATVGVARALRHHRWVALFRSDAERYLVWWAIVSYVVWVLELGIYRYLIPLEMLSFVLLWICVRALVATVPVRAAGAVSLGAIALISVLVVGTERVPNWGRIAWAPTYFSVSVPPDIGSRPAAFLMVGTAPDGYVVPYFPAHDYFARIQGNLTPTSLVRRTIIEGVSHYRRVFLLWSDNAGTPLATEVGQAHPPWARYGFRVLPGSCTSVPAKVGKVPQEVYACRLTRTG